MSQPGRKMTHRWPQKDAMRWENDHRTGGVAFHRGAIPKAFANGPGSGDGGQSSLLTLVMREEVPVDCRKISQIFSPAGVPLPFVARARQWAVARPSCRSVGDTDDGRGQSVNLAVRTLPLLISIVVSIVAPHPIHPFFFLFSSAERRQVQVVVRAD
jgi:hypothetical protein